MGGGRGGGYAIVRQEGGPGYERLVIPAASMSTTRWITLGVAVALAAVEAALLYGLLNEASYLSAGTALIFLGAVPLTVVAAAFASESVRILLGRESLSWEDVFVVHEMALPWTATTRTWSLSRIQEFQVTELRSWHPMELALTGKPFLAVRSRDGVARVALGLPPTELERLRQLANVHLTAARMRIDLRDGL